MTAPVVAVTRVTPYKEIAHLLATHQISGLPVVLTDQRVAGVISEADLVAARDKEAWRAPHGHSGRTALARRATARRDPRRGADDGAGRHHPSR